MGKTEFDATDLSGANRGWEQQLLDAAGRYEKDHPYYDEVFAEAGDRIRREGEASKADIAVITVWKRSAQGAWTGNLLALPDNQVRGTTRGAFGSEGDLAKLDALSPLPGFASGEAIPTALLCAHDPVDYAVMDWRARAALADLGLGLGKSGGAKRTLRYLARVRAVRDVLRRQRPALTAREVDKGLFVLGAPSSR